MSTETVAPPELVTRSLDASWNYARLSQLPEDGNRYGVIDGVLYRTTAPSYFYQWIIRQICLQLIERIERIERLGIGLTTWALIGLLMPGCEPVQPDIVVVRSEERGMIYDRRINGVPALIVEVLSPSNAEKDTMVVFIGSSAVGVGCEHCRRHAPRLVERGASVLLVTPLRISVCQSPYAGCQAAL